MEKRIVTRELPHSREAPFIFCFLIAIGGDACYNNFVVLEIATNIVGGTTMLLRGKSGLVIGAIFALVLGVALVGMGIKTVTGLKNAAKIEETNISDYKEGMWIKGTAELVWDYYCNETETKNGIETEKFRWYLAYFTAPGTNATSDYYIGIKVPAGDFDKYEKLMTDEPQYELTFQGKLCACTGDILKFKNQFMKQVDEDFKDEYGITASSFIELPDYYIELTTTKAGNTLLGVGIFCCVVGLFLAFATIHAIKASRKEAQDLANGKYYQSVNGLRAGNVMNYDGYNNVNNGGASNSFDDPMQQSSVGASTGFYLHGEQDELSQMLAEEDQKVANYNFETGLTGSDRVEDDK